MPYLRVHILDSDLIKGFGDWTRLNQLPKTCCFTVRVLYDLRLPSESCSVRLLGRFGFGINPQFLNQTLVRNILQIHKLLHRLYFLMQTLVRGGDHRRGINDVDTNRSCWKPYREQSNNTSTTKIVVSSLSHIFRNDFTKSLITLTIFILSVIFF